MAKVIEIGRQQAVIGAALGFINPEKAVDKMLEKFTYLTAREFSYVDSKGVRRFTTEGMAQLLRLADNPFAEKLREVINGDLTEEEAFKKIEEVKLELNDLWDKKLAEQEKQLEETEKELKKLKSMRSDY
jgi:hypothetical protein